MAFITWLRALNSVVTVADATRLFRARDREGATPARADAAEGLEVSLANVVVAALREAFYLDRARFDLERELHEAEQAHKARVLRLEWLRRTVSETQTDLRYQAGGVVAIWLVSAAVSAWRAPLGDLARGLLGLGWFGLAAALLATLVARQELARWIARQGDAAASSEPPHVVVPPSRARRAVPWLVVSSFVAVAASLLASL